MDGAGYQIDGIIASSLYIPDEVGGHQRQSIDEDVVGRLRQMGYTMERKL